MLYVLVEYQTSDWYDPCDEFICLGIFTDKETMFAEAPKNNRARLVYFEAEPNRIHYSGLEEHVLVLEHE